MTRLIFGLNCGLMRPASVRTSSPQIVRAQNVGKSKCAKTAHRVTQEGAAVAVRANGFKRVHWERLGRREETMVRITAEEVLGVEALPATQCNEHDMGDDANPS